MSTTKNTNATYQNTVMSQVAHLVTPQSSRVANAILDNIQGLDPEVDMMTMLHALHTIAESKGLDKLAYAIDSAFYEALNAYEENNGFGDDPEEYVDYCDEDLF